MKTLRIAGIICIMVFIVTISANSQPVRTQNQVLVGFLLPCMDNDIVSGTVTCDKISWTGQKPDKDVKIQVRLNDASLAGRQSGLTYTLSFAPYNLVEGGDASQSSRMMTLKLNGKLVARLPLKILFEPDGDIKFDINTLDAKCF